MRDRPIRLVLLGLILALPPLILATTPRASGMTRLGYDSTAMTCGIEAVLVVGLTIAARQRRDLRPRVSRRTGPA